jgi:hypothetical protein
VTLGVEMLRAPAVVERMKFSVSLKTVIFFICILMVTSFLFQNSLIASLKESQENAYLLFILHYVNKFMSKK